MRKIALAFLFGGMLLACSKTESSPEKEKMTVLEEPVEATASPQEHEGRTLINGADCLACHKEEGKLVGPSYREIAAKYTQDDVDQLADNIINGSSGVWGAVPMAPHAGLSKENAKKMVEYILTLK
ncbi:c-type cytochrome [Bergeyella sp. RCAD1439]|uniref:c-type cytochrome n=1 Tax=Bergeyella anatis TaxID=3113737 RepID=UPI002E17878B|nr:c-type cytochrome [Bergeyella sp. RCAD1439]